ncbi:hypothetical protein BDV98DRAFT_93281 [Pterulicium gracile]|uniref:Uncharacterized protein n=1 Tax=Pterulicium gracile TaxID=1884261 RepID=A0A5C3QG87_9AGAR|nr:hypothetical protein BDV98DRAFT_93281 [Pterula gracilis]
MHPCFHNPLCHLAFSVVAFLQPSPEQEGNQQDWTACTQTPYYASSIAFFVPFRIPSQTLRPPFLPTSAYTPYPPLPSERIIFLTRPLPCPSIRAAQLGRASSGQPVSVLYDLMIMTLNKNSFHLAIRVLYSL